MGQVSLISSPVSQVMLSASLSWDDEVYRLSAFVDSGTAGNFLDITRAQEWGIQCGQLKESQNVMA